MTFNLMVAKGTYTSHREQDSVIYILPEMQYVRVCTCCYCHDEKKTMTYELCWTQCSDVTLDGLITSRYC